MRILTGVDLRVEGHSWIVERSGRIARLLGARVDLLYVMSGNDGAQLASNVAALEQNLKLMDENNRGQALCVPGSAVDVLVETAADYDVMVVGPREPGALERLLLGSIAARVVRRSPNTRVLIPRGESKPLDQVKVLVGVDVDGPEPQRILAQAGDWALRMGGILDAVYIVPRMPHIPNASVRARAEKEWLARHQPKRDRLEALMRSVLPEEHRGTATLAQGEPESALEDLSKSYDFVCVGSLPRTGIAGLILGSVAEHVVRHAHCDVLAVPTGT